jgi:hypothetical protein
MEYFVSISIAIVYVCIFGTLGMFGCYLSQSRGPKPVFVVAYKCYGVLVVLVAILLATDPLWLHV